MLNRAKNDDVTNARNFVESFAAQVYDDLRQDAKRDINTLSEIHLSFSISEADLLWQNSELRSYRNELEKIVAHNRFEASKSFWQRTMEWLPVFTPIIVFGILALK